MKAYDWHTLQVIISVGLLVIKVIIIVLLFTRYSGYSLNVVYPSSWIHNTYLSMMHVIQFLKALSKFGLVFGLKCCTFR